MRLVISTSDDLHIPFVERHLDTPFVIFNTRGPLTHDHYSFTVTDGDTALTQKDFQYKNVQSVWYRHIATLEPEELPVDEGTRSYAYTAIENFNKLLFHQFADAFWVSNYYAIQQADDKLLQLQKAHSVGMHIPETVFSSDRNAALSFIRQHKSVIAKTLVSDTFKQNGERYAFYTSFVDEKTDLSGLHLAPAIFQQAIDVKTELRITVVGNKVFAASITSDGSAFGKHIRDWRVASLIGEASYEPFDLPKKIEDQCLKLVKELGLQFGAIDMIIDTKDKYWFLENNPNGQWAFIEEATKQPIGKALAELLMQGK